MIYDNNDDDDNDDDEGCDDDANDCAMISADVGVTCAIV